MIRLLTTFYKENNLSRLNELLLTLKINLELNEINEVYVLDEGSNLFGLLHDKLKIIKIQNRPTYNQYFGIINSITNSTDLNIIANTDIFFDNNINILKRFNFKDICLALSRWDLNQKGVYTLNNRNDSQDAWIFQGKVKESVNGDVVIGVPRCDNRILYELQKTGYNVLNPAFSIKTYHLHVGQRDEYPETNLKYYVDPPYAYIFPHNFYSLPKTIWFNLTHKSKIGKYHYDIKKINMWLIIRILRKIVKLLINKDLPKIGY